MSQRGRFPRVVEVNGHRFILLRGVFSPELFDSTHIFTPLLPVVRGCSMLEIGEVAVVRTRCTHVQIVRTDTPHP